MNRHVVKNNTWQYHTRSCEKSNGIKTEDMELRRDVSKISIRYRTYCSFIKTNLSMVENISYYAFPGSPVENVKVRIVSNMNRTLESFLISRKPSREILTKMEAN